MRVRKTWIIWIMISLAYPKIMANNINITEQQKISLIFAEFERTIRIQNFSLLNSFFSDHVYIQKEKYSKHVIVTKIQSFFNKRNNSKLIEKKYGKIVVGNESTEFKTKLTSSCDFQIHLKEILIKGDDAFVEAQFQLFGEIVDGNIEKSMNVNINMSKFDDEWLIVESSKIDEFFTVTKHNVKEINNDY